MNILMTGASGVLGRATLPVLQSEGHEVATPHQADLDLFDATSVANWVRGTDAILHLATRIPPADRAGERGAWADNDRLRDTATRLLTEAALAADTRIFVMPTITFVYPPGPADESTPIGDVAPNLRSALVAESHVRRFVQHGGTGIVLRLGSLYGPGARTSTPNRQYNGHLHTADAGRAIGAALDVPAGIYNVVDDGPVSHDRFTAATGWKPQQG